VIAAHEGKVASRLLSWRTSIPMRRRAIKTWKTTSAA
jgi:hypothetical protein